MRKSVLITITFLGLIALFSCKKDETRAILSTTSKAPAITAPSAGATLVLTSADSGKKVIFTWSIVDFSFPAEVTYTLQMDRAGNNFTDPVALGTVTSSDTISMTTWSFNSKLVANGFVENEAADVKVRVRAIIHGINSSSFADTSVSETINMTITPFEIIIIYPKLYVPGDLNGWAFTDSIMSVKSNDVYEGYFWFGNTGDGGFKLTQVPGWFADKSIGDPDASGTSGTLQIGNWGGNNIKVAGCPGYFRIHADLPGLTYSVLKTTWGLIGSATPDGWNSDQNMTYNVTDKVWTVTVDLVAGDIKFRANGGWDLNYGDNKPADGKLDAGGDNIAIADPGNYTITLNLSKPVYTYKVKKN